MQRLFHPHRGFLAATLATPENTGKTRALATQSGTWCHQSPGLLTFHCEDPSQSYVILSAGIHGNETAPIELLDRLVDATLSGELQPQKNCMFILGNPKAMLMERRFTGENLNRLFQTEMGQEAIEHHYERHRAQEIMEAVDAFLDGNSRPPIHYDLHTAIRASKFEKFAVYPYLPARTCPHPQLDFLGRVGIEAVLLQNTSSSTFSAWTAQRFGAESFTLELGKVNKFGANDPARLAALESELFRLLASEQPAKRTGDQFPKQFTVVEEIINTGTGFQLNIAEDTPNFTPLENGYEVWRDANTRYLVENGPLAIVFPNSKVAPGQRAGLLIKQEIPVLV